jgi:hypothetical protein
MRVWPDAAIVGRGGRARAGGEASVGLQDVSSRMPLSWEQVMEARRRTLGEEHPTRSTRCGLAIRFSEAGRGPEALQLLSLRAVMASHHNRL